MRYRYLRYKPIILLSIVGLIWAIGSGAFEFVLPIFIEDLTKNIGLVGIFLAIPSIVAIATDIPIGGLTDKFGRKKLIVLSLFSLAIMGLIATQILPSSLVIFLIIWGLFYTIFEVPIIAYIMDISRKRTSSENFGIYFTFISIGFAIGPIIGGFLLIKGFNSIFYFYSIFCILAFLVASFFLKEIIRMPKPLGLSLRDLIQKDRLFIKEIIDFQRLKETGVFILYLSFLFAFWDGLIWMMTPLYTIKLLITPVMAGLILSSFVIPFILFQIIAGKIADKYGKKKILVLGLLTASVFLIGFGMTHNPILLILFAFLSATGFAFAGPPMDGILTDISTHYRKGGIVGVWGVAEDLGYIFGPLVAGLIASLFTMQTTFLFIGSVLLVSVPFALLKIRH